MKQLFIFLLTFMSTMCYGQSHETVLEFGPYEYGTIRDYKTDERIDKLPKKYTTADISFYKGKAGDEIVGFKIADNETTFIALRKDERKSVVMEYPLKNKRYQMVHNYSLQAQQFAFVLGVNEILEPIKFDRAFDESVKILSRYRVSYYRFK